MLYLRHSRRQLRGLVSLVLMITLALTVAMNWNIQPTAAAGLRDNKGVEFWLAFPENLMEPELKLYITGSTPTTGMVEIPGLGFSTSFSVTPGKVTTVDIPAAAELKGNEAIEDKGIHVTARDEITVYGLNRAPSTTDAFLGLPVDILGTDHIILGYQNTSAEKFIAHGTQFAVVAIANDTMVTITPSITAEGHQAGTPYTITLNQGQTYQLRNTEPEPADLSGTIIISDKPIAVFGGHRSTFVPSGFLASDHLVEQLPPTETWGKSFVTMPLATRTKGDTFRFLASTNGTEVSVNGVVVATLNRGQFHERVIEGPAHITSNNPILVAQYSNSQKFDGVVSDPFMMLIPPFEQFQGGYTLTTPASGFATNFINVVAPKEAVGSILLDGVAIPADKFTDIGDTGFSGAQVPISLGAHSLSGLFPFGAAIYGFAIHDSYGYTGGLSLAPVARVTKVTLAPKNATSPAETEHCVTATVTDQNGKPLEGVRVDFKVTGANTAAGFANTGADGKAKFCYTGEQEGTDTITASVGKLSDTASKTWTEGAVKGADLAVQKSDSPDPVQIGHELTYTITVTNNGVLPATGVTLTDTLPAEVNFVSASSGCTHANGTVTCGLGNLAKDTSATVTIKVTPTAVGKITNKATVKANEIDLDLSNNTATAETAVQPGPDLSVEKSDSPDPVQIGHELTYTIVVTNKGTPQATGVTLTDTLPAEVNFVSASSGCTHANGTVTCDLGNLAKDTSATVTIKVTPTAVGKITNKATVKANEIDPDPGNNMATAETTVQAPPPPPLGKADLYVYKGDYSPYVVRVGDFLTYRIEISNRGPAAATGVKLTDVLPVKLSHVSTATSQGTCIGGPTVTCDLGTIQSGGFALVKVTVKPIVHGLMINKVTLTSNETDPEPLNNSFTQYTTVKMRQ
jgi:uncharacterized repeat protein (TIGR01451 family)